MGNAETDDTAVKKPKSSAAQEQPPASSPATVFPDWTSFQAYYNSAGASPVPPPGFFHSPVASSPQAHPYMWGQHIIPPYGTPPPPYVTMYTHGVYAHPSIPLGSHPYSPYTVPSSNGMAEASVPGANGKLGEQKSKIPVRRSKGSSANLDMLAGKDNETGKASGASANGGLSHSCSGNDGSCEGSDVNSQDGSQHKPLGEQSSVEAGTLNGSTACSVSSRTMWTPPAQAMLNQGMVMAVPPISVSGPTTNLNIGMDYWGGSAHSSSATTRTKLPVIPASAALLSSSEMDERELKRQRRKQSNRESARRSRLRKQAECEELAQRVETLKEENISFRKELEHLREECEKLASENASLTEKLKKYKAQDSGGLNSNLEQNP